MAKTKQKTHKATAKRFRKSASGLLKHSKQGDNAHLKINKNKRQLRRLGKRAVIGSKEQQKKLTSLMAA